MGYPLPLNESDIVISPEPDHGANMFHTLHVVQRVAVCALLFASGITSQSLLAQRTDLPDRQKMIETLNTVVDLLEAKDFATVEQFFYLPPNFKPEMFDMLLKRNVISRDGVLALEKGGTFGTLTLLYGEKRASSKTQDTKAPVEDCYAIKMEQGDTSCSVIVHWNEGKFKIVDIERVGKMVSADVVIKEPVEIAAWPTGTEPSKKLMLDSLSVLLHHIENEHYEQAKARVYVPEDFPAAKFKDTIERRELSANGIGVMRKIGKYGTAKEVFGATRAQFLCERVQVPVDDCFGVIAVADAQGETLAHWKGDQFKFLRADDIGKLAPAKIDAAVETAEPVKEMVEANPAATLPGYETDKTKIAQGLSELSAAIEASPKDALLRVRYARSMLVLGNTPEAWKQFCQAHGDAPEKSTARQQVVRGLDDTIAEFKKRGVFEPGVPKETLIALMGEPMQKAGEGEKRWVYPAWCIDFSDGRIYQIAKYSSATPSLMEPNEYTFLDLDRSWKCTLRQKKDGSDAEWYHPLGENVSNFTSEIVIERIVDSAKQGSLRKIAMQVMQSERDTLKVTEQTIVKEDQNSLYFTTTTLADEERTNLITRLVKGKKDVHRITASVRSTEPMTKTEIEEWTKLMDSARFSGFEIGSTVSETPSSSSDKPPVVEGRPAAMPLAYDVVLKSFGNNKIATIKALRSLQKMSLRDAKTMVEAAPTTFQFGRSKEDATNAKKVIEAAGAEVEIVPSSK